jgi:hypothetical protein
MGEVHIERTCGGTHYAGGNAAALGVADWLSLAATPTFAVMALLTGILGGAPMDLLCAPVQHGSALTGMVPMYLLMSGFHSAPWLKLVSRLPSSRWRSAPLPNNGADRAITRGWVRRGR